MRQEIVHRRTQIFKPKTEYLFSFHLVFISVYMCSSVVK